MIGDAELVSLYNDTISLFQQAATMQMTLLFSYLVAMFFIGRRLNTVMFWILNVIFIVVSYGFSGGIVSAGSRASALGQEVMRRVGEADGALDYLTHRFIPPDFPHVMRAIFMICTLLAIVFAVLRRRQKSDKAEEVSLP